MRVIGTVKQGSGSRVVVSPEYRAALTGLNEFSHVLVFWSFDRARWDEKILTTGPCYRKLDHDLRAPKNPIPWISGRAPRGAVDRRWGVVCNDA